MRATAYFKSAKLFAYPHTHKLTLTQLTQTLSPTNNQHWTRDAQHGLQHDGKLRDAANGLVVVVWFHRLQFKLQLLLGQPATADGRVGGPRVGGLPKVSERTDE